MDPNNKIRRPSRTPTVFTTMGSHFFRIVSNVVDIIATGSLRRDTLSVLTISMAVLSEDKRGDRLFGLIQRLLVAENIPHFRFNHDDRKSCKVIRELLITEKV